MRLSSLFVVVVLLVQGLLLVPSVRAADPAAAEAALEARSLVSAGQPARLERILARAQQGLPITIGVIGGSITQGALATATENRYGNLVAGWWRRGFPNTRVEFVNGGIGATGSNYGALRARRDLLSKHPDFVVVEYAVNDGDTEAAAETLEGLLRQILNEPQRPAVMLLFTMSQGGHNAQERQARLGRHYGLPMVSFRDALWPEIQSGRIQWSDVIADKIHPNDRGHAYCARFVTVLLDRILQNLSRQPAALDIPPLPPPLASDLFEHTVLYEADALRPVANKGWTYDSALKAWKSDQPSSAIELEVEGRIVLTMHYVVKGPMGTARVSVDGKEVRQLDGWFDQTWGGYRQTNEVARLSDAGKHRVRLELSGEKNPGSTGHEFHLLGLGTAGRADH